ncbi:neuropeptide F [Calliopsis andreniformis]|uniref:neuropeptide F n=1 Tax=Calliopsis andreniformis TaxID=337506 RepID=UPI003FCD3DA6
MQPYSNTIYLFLIVCILGTMIVKGEPEPMARPTRPEVISSPEEFRRYLGQVKDYYSLNGKARYGKRGDAFSSTLDANPAWNSVRAILAASQQTQEENFEKRIQEKSRFLRELDHFDDNKHVPRIDGRFCHLKDIVEKYYDDMQ